ncbi:MAG: hypothetical protein ACK54X_02830 [Burkholderiales bacterium]
MITLHRSAPSVPALAWCVPHVVKRRGGLAEGGRRLVNRASGAVGTAAARLACDARARVTGVCSADASGLVRAPGAARVVDRCAEDLARSGERWDLIVDVAGTASWRRSAQVLAPRGRLLLVLADLPAMLSAPWHARVDSGRKRGSVVVEMGDPRD